MEGQSQRGRQWLDLVVARSVEIRGKGVKGREEEMGGGLKERGSSLLGLHVLVSFTYKFVHVHNYYFRWFGSESHDIAD